MGPGDSMTHCLLMLILLALWHISRQMYEIAQILIRLVPKDEQKC